MCGNSTKRSWKVGWEDSARVRGEIHWMRDGNQEGRRKRGKWIVGVRKRRSGRTDSIGEMGIRLDGGVWEAAIERW